MININEKKLQQQLKGFEAVWHRVSNSKGAKHKADAAGLKLMPKKNCRKCGGRFN